jgi:hypothetical protein
MECLQPGNLLNTLGEYAAFLAAIRGILQFP